MHSVATGLLNDRRRVLYTISDVSCTR